MRHLKRLTEVIKIPIKVGDTVLGGRFKNKKIVVKKIGKNDKGDLTLNGKPLLKFRIVKQKKVDESLKSDKYEIASIFSSFIDDIDFDYHIKFIKKGTVTPTPQFDDYDVIWDYWDSPQMNISGNILPTGEEVRSTAKYDTYRVSLVSRSNDNSINLINEVMDQVEGHLEDEGWIFFSELNSMRLNEPTYMWKHEFYYDVVKKDQLTPKDLKKYNKRKPSGRVKP